MKVKVGIVGVDNTTITVFYNKEDKEVKNMHTGNWYKVAVAITRRRFAQDGLTVFPIEVTAPEWKLPQPEKKAA